ncbi:GNAT family N-acetyltransferase [Massilia eburnea]|uniref:GNAT family N-acetyltransferase n=1 Tax=Massilia eburnea TaxID=1776165 RepID=UPI003D6B708D
MITYAPVQHDPAAIAKYVALFAACFPGADKYNNAYLTWLYQDNPDGHVIGFDAWDGDVLAAHYVTIPAMANIGGEVVRVALSLNTATHPNYQGKGLFTKLAEMTYEAARDMGIDAVYGVANANSTPGFIRKLGFQLVEPLKAQVGIGGVLRSPSDQAVGQFERVHSAASLKWRCANPENPIYARRNGKTLEFFAPSVKPWLPAYAEIPTLDSNSLDLKPPPMMQPLRLFMGLVPQNVPRRGAYMEIPNRLKPSPLNFIYRSLSGRVPKLEPGSVAFSFLDFDAY